MPAVAVTDHGNMFGAVEFYSKAMNAGIKPIIGCEMYVAPGSRFTKGNARGFVRSLLSPGPALHEPGRLQKISAG